LNVRFALSASSVVPAVIFALSGCSPLEPVAKTAIPVRDIAATGAKLKGATVLDVDRFEPTATIGKKCAVRPLANATSVLPKSLTAALEQAKVYSLEQQGVSLLVMKGGLVIHRSFAENVDEATPTDSYSMHKSVFALAIGKAVDEGLIKSIDDPVGHYIAEWKNDPRGAITLREIMSMSSGLKLSDGPSAYLELLLSTDINAVALRTPMAEPPGKAFAYSNTNSQIGGVALERAIKQAGYSGYADYLEKKIWCPIGNGAGKLWLDRVGGSPHYYAGLFTDIENWARLGELIRNHGRAGGRQVVSARWIAEMTQPSASNPAYGFQIWRGSPWTLKRRYNPSSPFAAPHSEPYLAEDVVFFDGAGGQRVYIVPSAQLTIVRTGQVNFEYDDAKIVNLILAALE
jgi:CubicO group peptidase (beta-lactamase class C family)